MKFVRESVDDILKGKPMEDIIQSLGGRKTAAFDPDTGHFTPATNEEIIEKVKNDIGEDVYLSNLAPWVLENWSWLTGEPPQTINLEREFPPIIDDILNIFGFTDADDYMEFGEQFLQAKEWLP